MKKIVVLGSINMDLVTMVERKPLDGETITGKDFMQVGGGKGANQAISVSKLGGDVVFLGKVGEDAYGQELKAEMSKNKIDISKVEETEGPTGLATIIVDAKGENSIIVVPGANGKVDREYIDRHKAVIEEASTLLCQLELPLDTVKYAFETAKKNGVRTILNPAPAKKEAAELLQLSDIVVLNETEFDIFTDGDSSTKEDIIENSRILFDKGVKELIVTLGSKGVLYINKDRYIEMDAYKVEAIDTTAAGDSFIGGFIAYMDEGMEKAIDMGMKAGAIAVTRMGAQSSLATKEEVENFVKR